MIEDEGYTETFVHEVQSIIWCPSKELYGVIPKEDYKFEVKRCGSSNQAVFEVCGKVTQFSFMDEKGLRSVIGFDDGKVDIVNTDDGKVLHSMNMDNSSIICMEILEHKKPKHSVNFSSNLDKSSSGKRKHRHKFNKAYNSSQKLLLPIEFNEQSKNLKRKLKFFESTISHSSGECPCEQVERPLFLFVANSNGQLSIFINSCFPITSFPLSSMIQAEDRSKKSVILTKKMKAAKDLSKLFLLLKCDKAHHFLTIDTRFIGYRSGVINDVSKIIYESFEFLKFIENKFEECTTFWNIAFRKYNFEISQMEKACNINDKSKVGATDKSNKESKDKSAKSIIEDLKMLVVYSMMSKGLQKYFEQTISTSLKELAKREETIQNELDKIENLITNFIISAIEVVLLKLSTLKSYASPKLDGDSLRIMQNLVGLDGDLIDSAIERFFKLQRNFEALNLLIVEAKLDIKNLYVFISKNAMKFANLNNQQEDNDTALNTLNKYIIDMNRLLKFISSNGDLRLEKCKTLLENSSKLMGSSAKDLVESNQLESLFIQNLEKAYSRRGAFEDESMFKTMDGRIGVLLKETKEIFSQIYSLPEASISKFYRPLQQTILGTKDKSIIFDMYTDSSSVSVESEAHTEFNEEAKITISENNISDSNKFCSEVLFAIKYQLGKDKRDFLCIYYQRVEKKVSVDDCISFNIALEELPTNYNLCECVFYGKKTLIMLLKPKEIIKEEQSILGTINLETLQYNPVNFEERVNNLEDFIEEHLPNLEYGQLEFSKPIAHHSLHNSEGYQHRINNVKVIESLSVNNLTSSGSGSYSVLLHNRKLKIFS